MSNGSVGDVLVDPRPPILPRWTTFLYIRLRYPSTDFCGLELMNYEPPAVYAMNEWMASRLYNQGADIAEVTFNSESQKATSAGDTVSAATLAAARQQCQVLARVGYVNSYALLTWTPLATHISVQEWDEWASTINILPLTVAAHATNP